jgi:hypothetical protein
MNGKQVQVRVEVEDHVRIASEQFGDFNSLHEALGVLQEEFDEFVEAVRLRQTDPRRQSIAGAEAIDIAAVCLRIAEQCAEGKLTR